MLRSYQEILAALERIQTDASREQHSNRCLVLVQRLDAVTNEVETAIDRITGVGPSQVKAQANPPPRRRIVGAQLPARPLPIKRSGPESPDYYENPLDSK